MSTQALKLLEVMNRKMDEGWKMTDQSCPMCHTTIMCLPSTKEFYCFKCNLPAKFEFDDEGDESHDAEVIDNMETTKASSTQEKESSQPPETIEEYENLVMKREEERRRSDQMSKKMGEYLLKGWAMLEECCNNCLFPYMRSRSGELVCVGCGPVNTQKEEPKKEEKPVEKPKETEQKNTKAQDHATSSPVVVSENNSTGNNNDISEITFDQIASTAKKEAPKTEEKPTEIPYFIKEVPQKQAATATTTTQQEAPRQQEQQQQCSSQKPAWLENYAEKLVKGSGVEQSLNLYNSISVKIEKKLSQFSENDLLPHMNEIKQLIELQSQVDAAKISTIRSFY